MTLGTSTGEARIFFYAALGASRDAYDVGATYRALGIVGQRESAKGLNDGYRLWPRAIEDVTLTPEALAGLIAVIDNGTISNSTGKDVSGAASADITPPRGSRRRPGSTA